MKNKKDLFALIGIGIIVVFILGNALLDYNVSHAFSGWLVRLLGLNTNGRVENNDFLLRKIAHITEYACLGFLIQTAKTLWQKQGKSISFWCSLFCLLGVGVLDEFIQSFSNRTSSVSDVLLDFMGGVLGMVLAALLFGIIEKRKS